MENFSTVIFRTRHYYQFNVSINFTSMAFSALSTRPITRGATYDDFYG